MPRAGSRTVQGAALALVMACASDPAPAVTQPADVLRAVALEVQAGARLTLEAEAWRSFQPIRTGTAGDPLIVVVRLMGDAPIDAATRIDSVHLVHGSDTWTGRAAEESAREGAATRVEFVVRNGPNWAPGDSIDVVARVALPGGGASLLRAPRIAIMRVD